MQRDLLQLHLLRFAHYYHFVHKKMIKQFPPGNANIGLIGSKVRQSTSAQAKSISFCTCSVGSSLSIDFMSNLRIQRLTFFRSWSGFVVIYLDIVSGRWNRPGPASATKAHPPPRHVTFFWM